MKKIVTGIMIGVILSFGSVTYGASLMNVQLFSSNIVINQKKGELGEEYAILNYNGHAYVPIRFVAESMGAAVGYDEDTNDISILSNESSPLISDADKNVYIGNIRTEKTGNQTKVTGQMLIDLPTDFMPQAEEITCSFSILFYDNQNHQLGKITWNETHRRSELRAGAVRQFEQYAARDLTNYSTVKLEVSYIKNDLGDEPPLPVVKNENQQIRVLSGSSCWKGCVDKAGPTELIEASDYQPVTVRRDTRISIIFDPEVQPDTMGLHQITGDQVSDVEIQDHYFIVPQEPGTYIYELHGLWSLDNKPYGQATYVFAIHVSG